jgi:competence protein ComGD
MSHHQKGYTLIESLIVLTIFMIVVSITAFSFKPQLNMINEKAFISQLKADLYFAQQYAISNQRELTVNIIADKHLYQIYENRPVPILVERSYSPKIQIISSSLHPYFRYLSTGNMDRFGSFFIQTPDKRYRMTFLIGKGRFYVIEE